ncbi:MAG TPA: hypothetical protein VKE41_16125 [Roseiflexaceae bacterium]|nr:hypothetical protein [Roseiflexaceae bacterium]
MESYTFHLTLVHQAQESLAGALMVAGQLGGGQGERLADAAREAFVSGLSASLVARAVILALGTVGMLLLISNAGTRELGTGKQGERA